MRGRLCSGSEDLLIPDRLTPSGMTLGVCLRARIAVRDVDLVDALFEFRRDLHVEEAMSVLSCSIEVAPMMLDVTKGAGVDEGERHLRRVQAEVPGQGHVVADGRLGAGRSRSAGRG